MKRYNQDQGGLLERFTGPAPAKASQRLSTSSVSDLDMTPSMRYEILCMGLDRLPGASWADRCSAGSMLRTTMKLSHALSAYSLHCTCLIEKGAGGRVMYAQACGPAQT